MALPATFLPVVYSLAATFAWGTSDFVGGYGSRHANAVALTTVAHAAGATLMLALALATHASFPSQTCMFWSLAAGVSGGGALAIFYRALSSGNMGLAAPVSAVLGAAIPVLITLVHDGLPGAVPGAGFLLAGLGIWLISRPEDKQRPQGIGLAILAGVGFAGFFLLVRKAGDGSPYWIAGFARASALVVTGMITLSIGGFRSLTRTGAAFGVCAGFIDVSGSALFIRSSQIGRLDSAVVISSLYPAITVLLARFFLHEYFTRWKAIGMIAALIAVPMIAWR